MTAYPSGVVAVCTRDRPDHLRRALATLAAQDWPTGWTVLLVDNSDDYAATQRVFLESTPILPPLSKYVREHRIGFAHARNRAIVESADLDAVCFFDDDMVAPQGWLGTVVEAWRASRHSVLRSPVARVTTVPATQVEIDRLAARLSEENIPPAGTGGLLLPVSVACRHPFDSEYNLSGGEDTDLLIRLSLSGCRFEMLAGPPLIEEDRHLAAPLRDDLKRSFEVGRLYVRVLERAGEPSTGQRIRSGLAAIIPLLGTVKPFAQGDFRQLRQRLRLASTRLGVLMGAGTRAHREETQPTVVHNYDQPPVDGRDGAS